MTFCIITHVPHGINEKGYFAYAPYVREMNIWAKYVEEIIIVAPILTSGSTPIEEYYQHPNIRLISMASFDLLNTTNSIKAILRIPRILVHMYKAMQQADHIHLRCPGNIGLLGCLLQIAFPNKHKTAKYAGNWDPKAQQPWTYRLQKAILNNSLLTKNIQVLVYGAWQGTTPNIKPFFTATYSENDKTPIQLKTLNTSITMIFVGTLVIGKDPLYAIQLVEQLVKKGFELQLDLYGDGVLRPILEKYVRENQLENSISIKGNQSKEALQQAYQQAHFVILPSDSEGWPKAIAEGMFWGAVPIATPVSCVPFMLDHGNRGLLLDKIRDTDLQQLEGILQDQKRFDSLQQKAANWSRQYTTEVFEDEIKKLLKL